MSQTTTPNGRIADDQRVSVAARRAAVSVDKNAGNVVKVEPCGTVDTAAEMVVTTPCAGLARSLNRTGFEARGVLSSNADDPDGTVRVWIDEE